MKHRQKKSSHLSNTLPLMPELFNFLERQSQTLLRAHRRESSHNSGGSPSIAPLPDAPIIDPAALAGAESSEVPTDSVRGAGSSLVLEDAEQPLSSQDAQTSASVQLKAENIPSHEGPNTDNSELKSLLQQLVQLAQQILSRFGSPADMNNPFDFLP